MGEVGHPTVVLVGNVEGHFGGRTGSVDEERHAIRPGTAAQDSGRFHHFPHIDLGGLAGNRGDRRANLDVVIQPQEVVSVVAECGGCEPKGRTRGVAVESLIGKPAARRRCPDVYSALVGAATATYWREAGR